MKAASWLGPAVAGLVQRVGYVRKGCCQLGTKTRHDCDDRDGNARGNQAVFDGRGTGLVLQEFGNSGHVVEPD
jgi:hypothetical protein